MDAIRAGVDARARARGNASRTLVSDISLFPVPAAPGLGWNIHIVVDPVPTGFVVTVRVQLDEGGIRRGLLVTLGREGEHRIVRAPAIEGALELPTEVGAHVFVRRLD